MINPLDQFLAADDIVHVSVDGQMLSATSGASPVLLPGSFNPVHDGHWELARVAEKILGQPVAFELSVVNVDKPILTAEEIRRRLAQFNDKAPVWLTRAAKFIDKAERFPGAAFVIGADTALRIVLPRYYEGAVAEMLAALERMSKLKCRFLVACRVDAQGKCVRKSNLLIPSPFRHLFEEIPPEQFRWDGSSTDLRAKGMAP